jgi:hypothetical protein
MPCDTRLRENQTLVERVKEIDVALKRLETSLTSGRVAVGIAPNGAVVFRNWTERNDITDVCAYRTLASQNSWALRQAVAKAEALAGRKVNAHAVTAGHHSHDDGKTWHKGH